MVKLNDLRKTRIEIEDISLRKNFTERTFRFTFEGNCGKLYLKENGKYIVYYSNDYDNTKNTRTVTGMPSSYKFADKFKELNKKSLRVAYGFVDEGFKNCIPKQFYYIDESKIDKKVIASSIDASSQYPSGCFGRLPNAHNCKLFNEEVEPTEDYPFAFYLKSGNVCEYGGVDTRKWRDSKFAYYLFDFLKVYDNQYTNMEGDEVTILMKASDYKMDDTWMYFYNNKRTYPKSSVEYLEAKLVMNSTIGCWHKKAYDSPYTFQMAHIVAICIARGNQKILDKIEEIGRLNILHVCIDGIIYKGDKEFGSPTASIGEFEQEFTECEFVMKSMNTYLAMKNGRTIKFRHSAYDLIDGQEIDEGKERTFGDLDKLGKKKRIREEIGNDN